MIRHLLILFAVCGGLAMGNALELTPESPDMFFPRPDTRAVLRFRADQDGDLQWTLERFDGSRFAQGILNIADKQAIFPVILPAGYYILQAGDQRFGIFAAPQFTGKPDAFFGVDAALSWLLTDQPDKRKALVELLAANGVVRVRERLWLGDLLPSRDTVNVGDTQRAYRELRQLYEQNNIQVLDVSHDAPDWLKRNALDRYPDDLTAYGLAWQKIAQVYDGNWSGLEVWNEPDIGFGGKLPAEYYIPLVKTVSSHLRQAKMTTPIIGGVVTERCPEIFWQICLQSGLTDYVDAVSIHHYSQFTTMGGMIGSYRDSLAGTRTPGLPILVTECGSHYPDNGLYGNLPGSRTAAMQNVFKAAESKAFGAAGFYVFVYASYFEGDRSFSLWSKSYAPMPELAAYFTLIRKLANLTYQGDYASQRVFADRQHAVIILRKTDPGLAADTRYSGIDGRALNQEDVPQAVATDGFVYAETDLANLKAKLELNTEAMRCLRAAQQPPKSPPPQYAPIILAPSAINTGNHHFVDKSGITLDPAGGKFEYTVAAVNLGDTENSAAIAVRLPWETKVAVTPQTITLKPGESSDLTFALPLPTQPDVSRPLVVIFDGRSGNLAVSPMAVAVNFSAPGLKSGLAGAHDILEISLLDAAKWSKSASAADVLSISVTPQQTLKIEAKFAAAGNHWFYPAIKAVPAIAPQSQLLVRLRATVNGKAHLYCQVRDRQRRVFLSKQLPAPDNNWQKINLTAADFTCNYPDAARGQKLTDMSEVTELMFGESILQGDAGEVELSDLLFYVK